MEMGTEHRWGAWPLTGAGRQNAYKGSIVTGKKQLPIGLLSKEEGEDSGQTKSDDCYVS